MERLPCLSIFLYACVCLFLIFFLMNWDLSRLSYADSVVRLYESAIERLHVLLSWLQWLSSLFYIFIWDGQKWELHLVVWFSQLKGILKHMNFFLGGYLHTLIRFFPVSITLYSQKINHLNVQKYLCESFFSHDLIRFMAFLWEN